jgi:hypothetical protein
VLATLDGHGVCADTAFTVHLALYIHVRGTALNLELEAQAEAETRQTSEQWMRANEPALRSVLATSRFPLAERVITTGYDFDLDGLFEFGLQRMLDGLGTAGVFQDQDGRESG